MRQDYNESAIKDRAIDMLFALLRKTNPTLASLLYIYRCVLRDTMIRNIQKIGVHEYAIRLVKYKSEEGKQLNKIIEEARSHAKTSSNL